MLQMFTRTALAAVVAAGLGLAGTAPEAAAQTNWTAYTYTPALTIAPARGMARIAETMEKETNGALKISLHIGGGLPIGATDISNALSDNVVQLGDDGFFQGNLPVTGILRLPMLIVTPEEFDKAMAVMRPYFEKAYDKRGVIMLGHYYYPLQVAWSRKPLTSFKDLNSMKLRVTSPEQAEFMKRLGGSGVTIGSSDVPSALDRGVVDGVFTASSGGGKVWKDLLKYSYRLGPNFFDGVIAVNRDAFNKLPAPTQAKLKQVVAETAPWITKTLREEEDETTAQIAKGGLTVTPANMADVAPAAKLLAPYWDQWAKQKGSEASEALAKVRAALGR